MKKLFLCMAAIIALSMMSNAKVIVGMNVDIFCDDPTITSLNAANDFHVQGTVKSSGGVVPMITQIWQMGDPRTGTWTMTRYTMTRDTIDPQLFHFTVDFKTTGWIYFDPINPMWLHFGIIIEVNTCNVMVDVKGYWTRNGVKIGAMVPLTGFVVYTFVPPPPAPGEATILAGDDRVQIWNQSEVPVEVEMLELAISPVEIPLEDMFLTGLGEPGTGSSSHYPNLVWVNVPQGMIPPIMQSGQFFEISLGSLGMDLPAGGFLLMRGKQSRGVTSPDMATPAAVVPPANFWNQHEEPAI
jgi:hypothetical protein